MDFAQKKTQKYLDLHISGSYCRSCYVRNTFKLLAVLYFIDM